MDVIARHLAVAKPTLYRMAGTREALIRLAVDSEAERLLEAIHRTGVAGLFTFAADSPAGFALLFGGRYAEARPAVRRVENRLREDLMRGPRSGRLPADLVAAGLLGLAAGLTRREIEEQGEAAPERLRSAFDAVAKVVAASSD